MNQLDGLQWYDWIQPTNPFASIFFGIVFSFILAVMAWFDTKEIQKSLLLFLIGMIVALVFLLILYGFGYYG